MDSDSSSVARTRMQRRSKRRSKRVSLQVLMQTNLGDSCGDPVKPPRDGGEEDEGTVANWGEKIVVAPQPEDAGLADKVVPSKSARRTRRDFPKEMQLSVPLSPPAAAKEVDSPETPPLCSLGPKVARLVLLGEDPNGDRPFMPVSLPRVTMVTQESTIFGRDSTQADILIDSEKYCGTLSRKHCAIHRHLDGQTYVWSIQDLNSTNGTFINGIALRGTSSELRYGDIITLGTNDRNAADLKDGEWWEVERWSDTVFRFECGTAPAAGGLDGGDAGLVLAERAEEHSRGLKRRFGGLPKSAASEERGRSAAQYGKSKKRRKTAATSAQVLAHASKAGASSAAVVERRRSGRKENSSLHLAVDYLSGSSAVVAGDGQSPGVGFSRKATPTPVSKSHRGSSPDATAPSLLETERAHSDATDSARLLKRSVETALDGSAGAVAIEAREEYVPIGMEHVPTHVLEGQTIVFVTTESLPPLDHSCAGWSSRKRSNWEMKAHREGQEMCARVECQLGKGGSALVFKGRIVDQPGYSGRTSLHRSANQASGKTTSLHGQEVALKVVDRDDISSLSSERIEEIERIEKRNGRDI